MLKIFSSKSCSTPKLLHPRKIPDYALDWGLEGRDNSCQTSSQTSTATLSCWQTLLFELWTIMKQVQIKTTEKDIAVFMCTVDLCVRRSVSIKQDRSAVIEILLVSSIAFVARLTCIGLARFREMSPFLCWSLHPFYFAHINAATRLHPPKHHKVVYERIYKEVLRVQKSSKTSYVHYNDSSNRSKNICSTESVDAEEYLEIASVFIRTPVSKFYFV